MAEIGDDPQFAFDEIQLSGRPVDLVRYNRDPDDPAQPWLGTSSPPDPAQGGATFSGVYVVFLPKSGSRLSRNQELQADGWLKEIDAVGMIASLSVPGEDIGTFDAVVDGDRVWRILVAEELNPGTDGSILWELGLGR